MMDTMLRGFKWSISLWYQHGVIIFTSKYYEHAERFGKVFLCVRKAGLKLNSKKWRFWTRQINALWHLVDSEAYDLIGIKYYCGFFAYSNMYETAPELFRILLLFTKIHSKFFQHGGTSDSATPQSVALFVGIQAKAQFRFFNWFSSD